MTLSPQCGVAVTLSRIKARVKTVTASKNLDKCPPAILQKMFGLTIYSALDNLTQDQSLLILVALHHQD
eukprot:scaffold695_cov279-Chaetoceros_neogracile.AAC.12